MLWHRLVELDQNPFLNLSKCYLLENDYNGIIVKFALENIFTEKYAYLEPFISRINVVIAKKWIKAIKKDISEKRLYASKILVPRKSQKIIKVKSCCKCSIKGWYKFEVLFFVTS